MQGARCLTPKMFKTYQFVFSCVLCPLPSVFSVLNKGDLCIGVACQSTCRLTLNDPIFWV